MQTSFDEIIHKLNNDELWDFAGGIHPPERKDMSNQHPIANMPLAKNLYVTVKQHIGLEGRVIVESGQHVLKGQALTQSANPFAVPVHAPSSGVVTAIENHPSAHPSGIPELTIKIEVDGKETWTELLPMTNYQNQPKTDVLAKICDAGISGMGGAGFPSHIKLSPQKDVEFLIINGVECEPYITADDRLMREHAWQIRQGIDVLTHLLSPKQVIIAIEKNKPEAIEALQIACRENPLYKVVEIPTKYPSGGEKQLIQILTNREVPEKGLPIDVGVIAQNVGTCFAIADAILSGKPLIQRVVTVTGEAVDMPSNYWTLIGTPIQDVLDNCQYQASTQKQPRVIIGGPMMGFTANSEIVPIIKTSNCLLVPADKEIADLDEQACIRCGACADACPAGLLPQQLFWYSKSKELDKAQEYNLFDCIECGACAYVCPSEIPLVHYYRVAKADIRAEQTEKQQADKARERFEARALRLKAEQQARDEKHRLAAEARKQAMESKGSNAKDKIAAALARAKAKKQALAADGNENTSDTVQNEPITNITSSAAEPKDKTASSNQRVQAAIARAKAKKAATQAKASNTSEAKVKEEEPKAEPNKKVEPEITPEPALKPEPVTEQPVESAKVEVETEQKPTAELIDVAAPPVEKVATQTSNTAKEQSVDPAVQDKQAKISAAVAKAKARRAAQQEAKRVESQAPQQTTTLNDESANTNKLSEDQQLANKKRRIATAVAKAKAKKEAEKSLKKPEDDQS